MSKAKPAWIFGGQTQQEFDSFYHDQMKRIVAIYADNSIDELNQMLSEAQEKHVKAIQKQRQSGLASDKIYIEDASVRIENIKYVIAKRED